MTKLSRVFVALVLAATVGCEAKQKDMSKCVALCERLLGPDADVEAYAHADGRPWYCKCVIRVEFPLPAPDGGRP